VCSVRGARFGGWGWLSAAVDPLSVVVLCRALQAVNTAKREAYFDKVTKKRKVWLQALHEDAKNWIAEDEIEAVRWRWPTHG
jgi:hypothetical protein